jgi:FtsH-binding integral membrane protein
MLNNPWIATETSPYQYYDAGLRKYLLSVFNYMTMALGISGIVAYAVGISPELMQAIWGSPLKWLVMLAPIGMALAIGFLINDMKTHTAKLCLAIFAGLMGLSLSSIFAVFTMASISQVFFISAATFGTTAIWGYTTKRDLSNFGSFLMMGLIGIVIAGLVNIFLQSSVLQMVCSALGVVIFVGFTAYDMQQIKQAYYETVGEEREKSGVIGALNLYLDFVNIFTSLLNLIGDRK